MDETEHQQQVDPAILRLARFKGHQLAGKFGFARHDDEDIQQDLLLDYLRRSRSFESHRCSRRTFGQRVINNRVATLIEAQKAACRDHRVQRISLDQSPDDQTDSNLPRLDQILFRVAKPCSQRSADSQLNLRLDVERILIRLPSALVSICRLVMACDSAMDVAATAGISRATLYRRLGQVRAAFAEAGLGG
jgi:DNA-directed RNA polymerase specialized sigma24 family protein